MAIIKIYHKNAGIRATTGIKYFNTRKEAIPTITAYEKSKRLYGELYDYVIEEEQERNKSMNV